MALHADVDQQATCKCTDDGSDRQKRQLGIERSELANNLCITADAEANETHQHTQNDEAYLFDVDFERIDVESSAENSCSKEQ